MGRILDAAQLVVDQLVAADVVATLDPAVAAANRPCVLVAPPTVDYAQQLDTWEVVALSSHAAGTLAAVDELDQLLDAIEPVLYVERAEPRAYVLTPASGPVPAYIVRVTTSH